MKRVLAIFLCVLMIGAMSALTLSATAAVADGIAEDGAIVTETEEPVPVGVIDDNPDEDGTEPETTVETTDETTAETTGETTVETTGETTAETTVATTATEASTEAATQAATQPAKNANTPKTGDNLWLYIGIGIAVVAIDRKSTRLNSSHSV